MGDLVKAGSRRSASSFALASSIASPDARWPASRPPSKRMTVSKTWNRASMSRSRLVSIQRTLLASSSSSAIRYRVSSDSTMVRPTGCPGAKNSWYVPDKGLSSSWPQANRLYDSQALRNSARMSAAIWSGSGIAGPGQGPRTSHATAAAAPKPAAASPARKRLREITSLVRVDIEWPVAKIYLWSTSRPHAGALSPRSRQIREEGGGYRSQ